MFLLAAIVLAGAVQGALAYRGALDEAVQKLEDQWGEATVLTGAQYALRHQDITHANPKPKCPFVPAREMAQKLWGEKLERLSRHHS